MAVVFSRSLLSLGLVSLLLACQEPPSAIAPLHEPELSEDTATEGDARRDRAQSQPNLDSAGRVNPEFKKLYGDGVTIYLPPSYEGGNPQRELEKIASNLEKAGSEHREISEALRKTKNRVALTAFDQDSGEQGGYMTNVNVSFREALPGTSLPVFMETLLLSLEQQGYQIEAQKEVNLNGEAVKRLEVELVLGQAAITQLVYVFRGEDGFWLVTYATPTEEFRDRVADFEESVATFTASTTAAQRRSTDSEGS